MARPRTPKARTPRRRQQAAPAKSAALPPQLAALLAIVEYQITAEEVAEMGRALTAARAAFGGLFQTDECNTLSDEIVAHISQEAARGSWRELHQRIADLQRPEDSPLDATAGDFVNVYAGPAIKMALAIAYVYFAEGAK